MSSSRPSDLEFAVLALCVKEKRGLEINDSLDADRRAEHKRSRRPGKPKPLNEASTYVILDRLQEYGWIDARRDPNDGRVRLYRVNAEGKKVLNARRAEPARGDESTEGATAR